MADLALYQWIWPLKPPRRSRTVEMRVLALGLPRTGTTSLAQALAELGFNHTYHGIDTVDYPADTVAWCELLDRKQHGRRPLEAEAFDSVIGHCQAVADTPCCNFAEELIQAYPTAQIIINHRPDINSWYQSIVNTLLKSDTNTTTFAKVVCFFHPKLFWTRRRYLRMDKALLWRGDISKHATTVYQDHYRRLDQIAPPERTLRWTAQEGWEPLCKFLGVPIPEKPFPRANDSDIYAKTLADKFTPLYQQALVNMALCFTASAIAIAWMINWSRWAF